MDKTSPTPCDCKEYIRNDALFEEMVKELTRMTDLVHSEYCSTNCLIHKESDDLIERAQLAKVEP
jgi:hypothetical protein